MEVVLLIQDGVAILSYSRVITILEPKRLVVLGSTVLFILVGQLRMHMIGKRGG